METDPVPVPSQEAVDSATRLYNAIRTAFPQAVTDFESKWAAAHDVCRLEATSGPGNGGAFTRTEEFDALRRLGPKIIPFVVFKLAKDDTGHDLWGVSLYNALEKDPRYCVSPGEDLLRCGSQIVELNHQRNTIFKERAEAWKEQNLENMVQSTSIVFTLCDEYFDLLEMGSSIIAHVMVEYYYDQGGWWYDLLHEIIHGHKMGGYMIQKPVLFEKCSQFFNEGEHDQAPKYTLTPLDRWVKHGEIVDQ